MLRCSVMVEFSTKVGIIVDIETSWRSACNKTIKITISTPGMADLIVFFGGGGDLISHTTPTCFRLLLFLIVTHSTEEESDPSLDSMMMSQSCDLTTHLKVGSASQQQWSVTMETNKEPVVDIATVEYTTQLSQRLSQATMSMWYCLLCL